jgi:hypothetical protein
MDFWLQAVIWFGLLFVTIGTNIGLHIQSKRLDVLTKRIELLERHDDAHHVVPPDLS